MKTKRPVKTLQTRLGITFICFAVALLLLLWVLQIFSLQTFYEGMKTREVRRTADRIEADLENLDLSSLQEFSYRSDLFVHMETQSGLVLFTTSSDYLRPSMLFSNRSTSQALLALAQSPSGTVSYTSTDPDGSSTLVYGRVLRSSSSGSLPALLWEDVYLLLFAPLQPVASTVQILRTQLILITVVALLLACAVAYVLSRRLAKPLRSITGAAEELSRGHYGVTFEGTGYREAAQLADTLTEASAALARSDDLKKDLLANVSHDLRTPLTLIRSYAEMVRDLSGDSPEKRTEHLNVIIEEADRMNRLIDDLLTLSKLQAGALPLERVPFDLRAEAEEAVRPFSLLSGPDTCTVSLTANGACFTVLGDAARIHQVLKNLLTNAVRYSENGSPIEVRLTADADTVKVEVTDHGIGISPEDLEHIWERYYRSSAQAVRSASGGSGLGLAITKEILTQHGASYGAESTLGEGSTFWFALPLFREDALPR